MLRKKIVYVQECGSVSRESQDFDFLPVLLSSKELRDSKF